MTVCYTGGAKNYRLVAPSTHHHSMTERGFSTSVTPLHSRTSTLCTLPRIPDHRFSRNIQFIDQEDKLFPLLPNIDREGERNISRPPVPSLKLKQRSKSQGTRKNKLHTKPSVSWITKTLVETAFVAVTLTPKKIHPTEDHCSFRERKEATSNTDSLIMILGDSLPRKNRSRMIQQKGPMICDARTNLCSKSLPKALLEPRGQLRPSTATSVNRANITLSEFPHLFL